MDAGAAADAGPLFRPDGPAEEFAGAQGDGDLKTVFAIGDLGLEAGAALGNVGNRSVLGVRRQGMSMRRALGAAGFGLFAIVATFIAWTLILGPAS